MSISREYLTETLDAQDRLGKKIWEWLKTQDLKLTSEKDTTRENFELEAARLAEKINQKFNINDIEKKKMTYAVACEFINKK